jgi:hypothetical protein
MDWAPAEPRTPTNEPLSSSANRMAHYHLHSLRHCLFPLSHSHVKEVYIAKSRVLELVFPPVLSTPNPVSLDWSTSSLKRASSCLPSDILYRKLLLRRTATPSRLRLSDTFPQTPYLLRRSAFALKSNVTDVQEHNGGLLSTERGIQLTLALPWNLGINDALRTVDSATVEWLVCVSSKDPGETTAINELSRAGFMN